MTHPGSHYDARHERLGVLLMCFADLRAAIRAHRALEAELRSNDDDVLDSLILLVTAKHRVFVFDPRRDLAGLVTAAVTWGVFGLLTGSSPLGVLAAGVVGAICGALFAFVYEHVLTKDTLGHIGSRLPARTFAVLTFVKTSKPEGLLKAGASQAPNVVSAAAIEHDLRVSALDDSAAYGQVERPKELSLVVSRYLYRNSAQQVIEKIARSKPDPRHSAHIELVIEVDPDGQKHVADISRGAETFGKNDALSWAAFGLVFGVLAGLAGGGAFGFLGNSLETTAVWGLLGLLVGAAYGLWAARAISVRRIRGVDSLFLPGSSNVLAWVEGPPTQDVVRPLAEPGSERLVLRFIPVDGGAVLAA
jgi:hypothetical protein